MTRIKSLLAAAAATVLLTLSAPAFARFARWPNPMPPAPAWGDYDQGHAWHDATWWSQNQPSWARTHHPEWWGDWDDDHVWHPAWWWWDTHPGWVRAHHPEWWGDFYQGNGTRRRGGSVSGRLGPRASSRMVGRHRRWRLVSGGMVVAVPTRDLGPESIIPNGGAILGTISGIPRRGGGNCNRNGSAPIIPIGGATTTRASGTPRRGGISIIPTW